MFFRDSFRFSSVVVIRGNGVVAEQVGRAAAVLQAGQRAEARVVVVHDLADVGVHRVAGRGVAAMGRAGSLAAIKGR